MHISLPELPSDWLAVIGNEFQKPYFTALTSFLEKELAGGQTLYPPMHQIFQAFWATPFESVRVVILGQDPYHGPGQAHGLCFSVPEGIAIPPSLLNIFKEIHADTGRAIPEHGNLMRWASQGVLLLNATLTVRAHAAGSHQHQGWEHFTDAVIRSLSARKQGLVFLLWGNYAGAKASMISGQHSVLRAPHPSPLSAHRGFMGCRHFSKANAWLIANGYNGITW
jgi:uracil-DNA glycosylase